MAEQYFAPAPRSRRRPSAVHVETRGHAFTFVTDAGVFSREGLDRGSEILLEALQVGPNETLLDLGCGYGVLGIVAARLSDGGHVILTDVNRRAVALARKNLEANRVTNAEVRHGSLYEPVAGMRFDHILCNPPLRAGRSVVDRIVEDAPDHLFEGGRLWLVVRTKQGARSLLDRTREVFPSAQVVRRGSGYKVLCATNASENLRDARVGGSREGAA